MPLYVRKTKNEINKCALFSERQCQVANINFTHWKSVCLKLYRKTVPSGIQLVKIHLLGIRLLENHLLEICLSEPHRSNAHHIFAFRSVSHQMWEHGAAPKPWFRRGTIWMMSCSCRHKASTDITWTSFLCNADPWLGRLRQGFQDV